VATSDLVVGTHALVQEGVAFHDLSLAVIDEQHRFGVHQRMALKGKGGSPDVLIMTATPIPRTLALTYYGDLDVVVLDEMPLGRRPVETRIARSAEERRRAYDLVRREVAAGRQAFVVCAAIDEANKTEVRAAEAEAKRLAEQVFPDLSVHVLHGRMRPAEKERVMDAFRSGEHHLLISTTVIEVGVDVRTPPSCSWRSRALRSGSAAPAAGPDRAREPRLLLRPVRRVEAGQRGGALSARGDGPHDGRFSSSPTRTSGFGARARSSTCGQSGMPDLKLARLAEDIDLVKRARARAFEIVDCGSRPRRSPRPPARAPLEVRALDRLAVHG